MDVGEWLRNLGLGKYEPEFIANAIDLDVLPELTEDDLEKLGLPLGDRKRFIRAIKTTATNSPEYTNLERNRADAGQTPCCNKFRRASSDLTVMICDLVGSTALSAPARSRGHERGDRCISGRLRTHHVGL